MKNWRILCYWSTTPYTSFNPLILHFQCLLVSHKRYTTWSGPETASMLGLGPTVRCAARAGQANCTYWASADGKPNKRLQDPPEFQRSRTLQKHGRIIMSWKRFHFPNVGKSLIKNYREWHAEQTNYECPFLGKSATLTNLEIKKHSYSLKLSCPDNWVSLILLLPELLGKRCNQISL